MLLGAAFAPDEVHRGFVGEAFAQLPFDLSTLLLGRQPRVLCGDTASK
jgi:hypothetical protein